MGFPVSECVPHADKQISSLAIDKLFALNLPTGNTTKTLAILEEM